MSQGTDSSENSVLQDYERIWEETLKEEDFRHLSEERSQARSEFYNALLQILAGQPAPWILEVGCGTSIDLNVLALSKKDSHCFGTDMSLKSIEVSRKVAGAFRNRIFYFVADACHLPVKSNCFELVYSQGLMEHFKDPLPAAREQARVVKTGGFLVINVPQRYTGYSLMTRWRIRRGKWTLGWETDFSCKELSRLGQRLNLMERKIFGYQYWKTWKEPLFVLRDLYDKFHRRSPHRDNPFFRTVGRGYEFFWKRIESLWGRYFLQNIVIVLEKPLR